MTGYIFDWAENSEKILRTGQYTTQRFQRSEAIALTRYLRDKGKTYEEILEIWYGIPSMYTNQINGDEDRKRRFFNRIWSKSETWKNREKDTIVIYKEELDAINSILTFAWVKEYLIALLAVYKFNGTPWSLYDGRIRAFCFSLTRIQRERPANAATIQQVLKDYAPYEVRMASKCCLFRMNIFQEKGTPALILRSPRDLEGIIASVVKNKKKCSKCGKEFTYTSQTIRKELCPDCYRQYRYDLQNSYKKRNKDVTTDQ